MKKIVRKVYSLNRGWWDSFTSCFIGTLLGIGITFWISAYMENENKKEMEQKIQLLCLSSIQVEINSFKDENAKYMYKDSLFSKALQYYPDSIAYIPKELVSKVYTELMSTSLHAHNQSPDNIFTNSIEIWKSIDNLTTIKTIGDVITYKHILFDFIEELERLMKQINSNIQKEVYIFDCETHTEAISYLFKNKENLNLLIRFSLYSKTLNISLVGLEDLFTQVKHILNIDDETLNQIINSGEYKDINLNLE